METAPKLLCKSTAITWPSVTSSLSQPNQSFHHYLCQNFSCNSFCTSISEPTPIAQYSQPVLNLFISLNSTSSTTNPFQLHILSNCTCTIPWTQQQLQLHFSQAISVHACTINTDPITTQAQTIVSIDASINLLFFLLQSLIVPTHPPEPI